MNRTIKDGDRQTVPSKAPTGYGSTSPTLSPFKTSPDDPSGCAGWATRVAKVRFVDRVTIRGSVIEPLPPINGVPFLIASRGGGPEIGHPGDPLTTGHLVDDNRFIRSGDDAVAIMDASGIVRNNRISDATAAS